MAIKALPDRELVRQLLRYDPETGDLIWLPRPREMFAKDQPWRRLNNMFAGKVAGTINCATGYRMVSINGEDYMAHRLIWLIAYGEPIPETIDHINRNKTDNRIVNLRSATRAQNRANSQTRTITGIKGVYQEGTRFKACIRHEKKLVYLGMFKTAEDAAKAYQNAAVRLHGKFARWD